MGEAAGVGLNNGIENKQLIDFKRGTIGQKTHDTRF
jgi:hypothetical protein